MAGSMSRADLVLSLKESLLDAAGAFVLPGDADFERQIDTAVADMHRIRPRTLVGEVTLIAEQGEYAAPADMVRFKSALWGVQPDWSKAKPWEKTYPGRLPTARLIESGKTISLSPPPSSGQIALLGNTYRFYYVASHRIGTLATDNTISSADRHLVILRAQVEAMRELALRDSVRPVQIGGGFGSQAKTGTPAVLAGDLMAEWLKAAA